MLYQNVRGLKTKLPLWRNNLALSEHNLVAVTETFLDSSVEDSELICGDWNIIRRDRSTPCGGVALAARAPIVLRRRRDLETDNGEDLWASFTWHGRSVFMCVVYLKPSASESDYMRWFYKIETSAITLKAPIIILGDINLNSASLTVNNYYWYFLSYCNLSEKNVVNNAFGGMLDVVLVQDSDYVHHVSVTATEGLVPPDAYHPPLDIGVSIDTAHHSKILEPTNISPSLDWNFKKCDYNLLFSLLSANSWNAVLEANDVNSATDFLYDTVYKIFDDCMSKKRRTSRTSERYPVWFTYDIIRDIRQKSKLHMKWKHTNCEATYHLFSKLRADLKVRTAAAYSSYMKRIECNIRSNPNEFWRHISSLRSRGGFEPSVACNGKICSGVEAAEAFANFFATVFLSDIPLLNAELACNANNISNSNYVNIVHLSLEDVMLGINKLKISGSVGPDGIPSTILKQAVQSFSVPLLHIFNLALKTGKYPPQWKFSRVIPIPKGVKKANIEDYRPIAVLSSPAKVFESIIRNHVYAQVNKYLCDEQHGFRSKRSVDTNLLSLVNFISSRLDRGSQVDVLYFDFRKAFDRVNNDILLAKLSSVGFAPGLLRLFADYLRDRQQFVRLGIYESRPYHTRSGVSQGSILGPLMFLLMVNDLPSVVSHARCLLYADDLKLFLEIKTEADCMALQRDIDAVCQWSSTNAMEFNTTKCCAMTFGRRRLPITFDYLLNGVNLSHTTTVKDLGVVFDRKLTFHDHMVALAKDSFRRLGFILRNSKDFSNQHVIRLIFAALVRSKLETSACVWNPHESTYVLLLEKVQKAFLRYLYKRVYGYYPYLYPTNFLLGSLGYNSLEVRRGKLQLAVMCKVLHGMIDTPELHNELCQLTVPDNYRRSRRHNLLAVPQHQTTAHKYSPIPRTLSAFNALLQTNPNLDLFADAWPKILSECLKFCEKNR